MAGSEKSGLTHLTVTCLRIQFISCVPTAMPQHMFKQFEMLIKAIGAIPYTGSVEHDIAMAKSAISSCYGISIGKDSPVKRNGRRFIESTGSWRI